MKRRKKHTNRKGMGTVEIVIIIAYGKKIINYCFDESKIQSQF